MRLFRYTWVILGLTCGVSTAAGATVSLGVPTPDELILLRQEARAYEHGEGVPKDPLRAASLYCDGARFGDAEAQYALGWMYANGRGVPRSDSVAAAFFKLAEAQGHAPSQRMLRFVGTEVAALPDCMRMMELDDEALQFSDPTPLQKKVFELVHKLAPQYALDPRLVLAVIRAESNFDPVAVSNKNAQGLMQLIPETSLRFNVKKPFDPEQNIRGGMSYLRWLLAYFEGDVQLAVAAYNAGEGAINRYRGVPPYAETRDYVKRIQGLFKKDSHPFNPTITAPSPDLPKIRMLASKRKLVQSK